MKKVLIVANWKMNPATLTEAKRLFDTVKKGIKNTKSEVVVCPPYTQFSIFNLQFSKNVKLGAQDCFWEEKGAYTGEVSPTMLKDLGVEYVILGHSERRKYLNETDEMINKKVRTVLKIGLKPILCVSSKYRGKQGDKEMKIQLTRVLVDIEKSDIPQIIFTYEPIWAISTTKNSVVATPKNTKEGGVFIRKNLSKMFDKNIAQKARVIYGGSVDSKNIEGFIKVAKMDGVLIGAASLRSDDFVAAVKNVDFMAKKR